MSRIALVTDVDRTLTRRDTILDFFGLFGKRQRAKTIWERSISDPQRVAAEFGIPLKRVRPSIDVELVFKEILAETGPVPLSAFRETIQSAPMAPGAASFIRSCQALGDVFLLTSMHQPQADAFAVRMGLPAGNTYATALETDEDAATGFIGPVREGLIKAETLGAIRDKTALPLARFVGIGDSASDAPFIRRIVRQGGLGLAVTNDKSLQDAGAIAVNGLASAARMIQEFAEGKTP